MSHDQGMDIDAFTDELVGADLRASLAVVAREDKRRAMEVHREVISVLQSMGRPGTKFRRWATRRTRAIVSEMYSAARVTASAARHARLGMISGIALDLTQTDQDDGMPWDFSIPARREKAERLLDEQ